ncbi:polysaccharide biosynthesis/export family protein [Nodosilinea sp. LEGE 07088]|uniref:polysaccharide biosynthesis/export family protein n=1 Tax=Nodosilinea sp. LEGE 07088 TaxID=2777968 RepID=UPI00187EB303|nr:polysaccharide biosynthesis/export family protein [Nodosilinea sp. LEGE 07088]MBE9135955.1 polysaccharide biosynthesis/export family protein [Nodosilinea sp. LEGE 07088]
MTRLKMMFWSLVALGEIAAAGNVAQAQTIPLSEAVVGGEVIDGESVPQPRVLSEISNAPSFPEAYVLGPGDRIRIDIFNIPEFSGPENGVHEVLVDGSLTLPLAGTVVVTGLTLAEAQTALAASYAKLLTRPPQLTVTLLSARPVRVVVAGEVNRPGTYTIELEAETSGTQGVGNAGRQWPTLTQVIQAAGGITQQANVKAVQVRRPQLAGDAILTTSLWDLIRTGDISQDIRLRDGDTVVIPKASGITPEESVAISSANFSPAEIPVQVVGEVATPGGVTLPANATLNQAILAAGGFDASRAQHSTVQLVRLNPDGSVDQRTVEVDLSAAANDSTNPILRPNDVVIVDRNSAAAAGDTLGLFLGPLTPLTTLLRLFGL